MNSNVENCWYKSIENSIHPIFRYMYIKTIRIKCTIWKYAKKKTCKYSLSCQNGCFRWSATKMTVLPNHQMVIFHYVYQIELEIWCIDVKFPKNGWVIGSMPMLLRSFFGHLYGNLMSNQQSLCQHENQPFLGNYTSIPGEVSSSIWYT